MYTLIDQGSMRSFISKRVVSALALKPTPLDLQIKGVGNVAATTHGFCNLTLSLYFNENKGFPFKTLVRTQLTSQLPSREIRKSDWPHLWNLQLAHPDFLVPKQIDCLR